MKWLLEGRGGGALRPCVREIRLLCIFLEAGANLIPGAEGLDCLLLSVTGRVSVRNTIFIYSVFLREGGGRGGEGRRGRFSLCLEGAADGALRLSM